MSNTASYIGKEPTYGVFITQAETGDGSTVAFTLDATAATTASLIVSVGGVVQQPAVAYNINSAGTILTFTGAPESAEPVWILFLGQTLTVPQASSANTTMITGESALGTAPAAGDYFLIYDADAAAMKKVAYSNLETGDISSVVAGTGLSGGGTTGAVTLNVEAAQTQITSLGTIGSLVATTADINAGTFDGVIGGTTPAAITGTTITGNTSVTTAQVDITAQGDLRLQDTTGGEYVGFQAAGTTTTYTVTMPAAVAASSGQALTITTAGVGSWTSVGDASLASDQTWTGSQRGTLVTDNDGSFDQDGGNNFFCTPSGNITLTFTNHTSGQSGYILLDNAAAGTVSLHANTKGDANLASTLSTAGTYLVSYLDNGTNAYLTTSAVFA